MATNKQACKEEKEDESGKTNLVLSGAEKMVGWSKHVHIHEDAVASLALLLLRSAFPSTTTTSSSNLPTFSLKRWKEHELNPSVADEAALHWILVVDTLNFAFWSETNEKGCTVEWKGKEFSGYWSLPSSINRALHEGIPITSADYLQQITEEQLAHIMRPAGSDNKEESASSMLAITSAAVPLFKERVAVLRELGTVLNSKFDGTFVNCIKQANGSAQKLISLIVANFKSYDDTAIYNNVAIHFYKRVQILVSDIWACFEGKSYGEFYDIDTITMFADYRVPQVLKYFGVVSYSEELLHRLLHQPHLPPQHPFELEIRANSIWAVELVRRKMLALVEENEEMKRKLKHSEEDGIIINAITIDFYLWDYAKQFKEKMQHIPIHKTRSIFY